MARIVLGVSGGIAAYKACSLLRLLTESGHDVTVISDEPRAVAARLVELLVATPLRTQESTS